MALDPFIELEKLQAMMDALKAVGGTPADQKAMNLEVTRDEIVPRAKVEVPVRSGDLRDSIRADATAVFGIILAGHRLEIPYGSVIHFGWATRGLGRLAQGDTAAQKRKSLKAAQMHSGRMSLAGSTLNKAARQAVGGPGRNPVRGGPIRPQPFIYEAIDARADAVVHNFEAQIMHRAALEMLL